MEQEMPKPESKDDQIKRLAEILINMRFDALIFFGEQMSAMTYPDGVDAEAFWDLKEPYKWAEMLHDWAEYYLPEGDE